MWALLLIIVVGAQAQFVMPETCTNAYMEFCFLKYVDADHDNAINATEWDDFQSTRCGQIIGQIQGTSGEDVIAACDMTHDGLLTVADFDAPNACTQAWALQYTICMMCDMCEALPPITEAPSEAPTAAP